MNGILRFERWLRIPPDAPADLVIRYRAIWLLGVLFIGVQILNFITMTVSYQRLTYDHLVSVMAAALVVSVVISLRWYKNYHVYAVIYSTIVIGGVAGSALPGGAGINSALLSLFVIGPILNGYISGRKATLLFWFVSTLFLVGLYWVSISHPPRMVSGDYQLEFNRLTNAIYYLTVATGLSVMLTQQTFSAMVKMRENEERARRAEAAKSDFLAKMSHELRTPLNGVLGLTDALLMSSLPSREKNLAQSIRKSGDSLLLILNDILDLSKIEAGKMSVNLRSTPLKPAIESAFEGWREVAQEKGLEFRLEMSNEIDIGVAIDELRLRQIIHNLLSNAIKFTETGRITAYVTLVRPTSSAEKLVIRVQDTGVGIPPQEAERIFEVFEQGGAPAAQLSGTGLGLPICQMLTGLLGGTIELETTSNQGSIFKVILPVQRVSLPSELATETSSSFKIDPRLKVLVVEDHEINRLVLSEYLTIIGVQFEMAGDGLDCLDRLREERFDLILMDKNMPRMNGLEATAAIRASDAPWSNIPIVALTADAMLGERDKLLAAGMDAFITKPVRIEELTKAMSSVSSASAA